MQIGSMNMKIKIDSFLTSLSFFLILSHLNLAILAHPIPDYSQSPFGFLKDLEGSHKGTRVKGIYDLKQYLKIFGYLPAGRMKDVDSHDLFDDETASAVRAFQRHYNLKVTGTLNHETVSLMIKPRCGVPDENIHGATLDPQYKFFPENPKWPPTKSTLTYAFRNQTRELVEAVRESLREWQMVSHFKFQYADDYTNADLKFSFETNDHGDGSPFGGAYAHSFRPTTGVCHFNIHQNWTLTFRSPHTVNLYTVSLHEIGHILGLDHSTVPEAIMWPYIGGGEIKNLHQDDVQGIRTLYNLP